MRDYLETRGYEVLNCGSACGASWSGTPVSDRAPSVVVFAMDHVPATVASSGAATPSSSAGISTPGGKVVWTGIPPLIWPRDPKTGEAGDYSHIDRESTHRLLGVDHARSNFDGYGAAATPAGQRWGLSGWWESNWSVDPSQVTEALALDDNGLAGAWVKNYGGPPGTGFVRVYGGGWMGGVRPPTSRTCRRWRSTGQGSGRARTSSRGSKATRDLLSGVRYPRRRSLAALGMTAAA